MNSDRLDDLKDPAFLRCLEEQTQGRTLKPDPEDNRDLYGKNVSPHDVLMGTGTPPAATEAFMAALRRSK